MASPIFKYSKKGDANDTAIAGKSVRVAYSLFNEGKKDMVIEDYKLSCECTSINLNKNTIICSGDSINVLIDIATDTSEMGKQKVIYCTVMCNTKPKLNTIRIPIYIRKGP